MAPLRLPVLPARRVSGPAARGITRRWLPSHLAPAGPLVLPG